MAHVLDSERKAHSVSETTKPTTSSFALSSKQPVRHRHDQQQGHGEARPEFKK